MNILYSTLSVLNFDDNDLG